MTQTIEQLNTDHGLESVSFAAGTNGFPMVQVSNAMAKATLSVYGGQVLSFQPTGGTDIMFVSKKAYYAEGKAIKGGAPVCWPWFGPDPEGKGRAAHGFVRNRLWNVVSTETLSGGETKVVLGLSDTAETREIWPQAFELAIAITVGKTLHIDLITRNKGDAAFSITQALHTYFSIADINQVKVSGLEGKQYIDKVDGSAEKAQDGAVTFAGEVDRIYLDVPAALAIEDGSRRIDIASSGSKTAVVWNPWSAISVKSGDLEDDSYQTFVCVETTNAATDVVEVPAGGEYCLSATYSVA